MGATRRRSYWGHGMETDMAKKSYRGITGVYALCGKHFRFVNTIFFALNTKRKTTVIAEMKRMAT